MLELNKIYQGDCLEVMKQIDDNSVDLIITSPPYNIGIEYDSYIDNLEWNDYLKWCKLWLQEIYRILKDDGRLCINHYIGFTQKINKKDRFPLMDIRTIEEEIGFNVKKLVIWNEKSKSVLTAWGSWISASCPYIQTPIEGILISCKKEWKKKNKGVSTISKEDFIKGVSGVWNFGAENKQITKASFPIKLPEMCINLLSYKNDIILDPFIGSGTTAVACINTNRNFIGIELSEKYCKIAEARINKAKQENITKTK